EDGLHARPDLARGWGGGCGAGFQHMRNEKIVVCPPELQPVSVASRRRSFGNDQPFETRRAPSPVLRGKIAQDGKEDGQRDEPLLSVDDREGLRRSGAAAPPVRLAAGIRQQNCAEEVVRVDRLLLLSERDQDVVEKLPRFLDRPGIAALVGWNRVAEGVGEELDDAKGRSEDTWEHLVLMVGAEVGTPGHVIHVSGYHPRKTPNSRHGRRSALVHKFCKP